LSKADAVPGVAAAVDGYAVDCWRRIVERHRGIIAAVIEARIANRDAADGEIARVGGFNWHGGVVDVAVLKGGARCITEDNSCPIVCLGAGIVPFLVDFAM